MTTQLSTDDVTKLTKAAMSWYIAHDPEVTFGTWILTQFYADKSTQDINVIDLISAQRAADARLCLCGLLNGGSLDPEPMVSRLQGMRIGGSVFEL